VLEVSEVSRVSEVSGRLSKLVSISGGLTSVSLPHHGVLFLLLRTAPRIGAGAPLCLFGIPGKYYVYVELPTVPDIVCGMSVRKLFVCPCLLPQALGRPHTLAPWPPPPLPFLRDFLLLIFLRLLILYAIYSKIFYYFSFVAYIYIYTIIDFLLSV